MQPEQTPKNKLAALTITLTEDVVLRENANKKPFAFTRGTDATGRRVTVMTYVHAGIAAIRGSLAGQTLKLYGTYNENTYAAMGRSDLRTIAK